jgi:predicted heme/steroid binding protein
MDVPMRAFSREDLARNDGKNGSPAYVAYRGIVYDATASPLWTMGSHQGMHEAGKDLTDDLESMAPHGTEVLGRCPKVGTLNES